MSTEWIFEFEDAAYRFFWLPNCLEPAGDEPSQLTSREVYEHYEAFCEAAGITYLYSLPTVRSAVRDHYRISNIRTGLREFRLVDLTSDLDVSDLRRKLRAESSRRHREYEANARLQCRWCEVRYYDGNRFDHCYWCQQIMSLGFERALDGYLSRDSSRTGASMRAAYRRMRASGLVEGAEIADEAPSSIEQVNRGRPLVLPRETDPAAASLLKPRPYMGRKTKMACGVSAGLFLGTMLFLIGVCASVAVS